MGVALSGATTATFGNRAPGSGERLRLHYVSLYRSAPRGVHCSYWARRACVLFSLRRLSVVIVVFVFFFFFFFFLPSFASRLVVVTVFSRRQPSLAEPRCSSVSNNHDIRACGKSTCWLPLNESERARAHASVSSARRTIKSRSSRECTAAPGPQLRSRDYRLPVGEAAANFHSVDPRISKVFSLRKLRGNRRIPRISARYRDVSPRWCTIKT